MVETRGLPGPAQPSGSAVRPTPGEPPRELDGFRFARVFDGFERYEAPLTPRIDPVRRIPDPSRRERFLDYLRSGVRILRSDVVTYDWLDPDAGLVVPQSWFTDGSWIWPESLAYYLERHGVGPERALRERIVKRQYRVPGVRPAALERAVAALGAWGEERRRLAPPSREPAEAGAGGDPLARGEASNEPPTVADFAAIPALMTEGTPRFDPQVRGTLVASWWLPGRDVTARIEPWLSDYCARPSPLDGSRYEAFPAARRVLAEFGLLDIEVPDWGEERPTADLAFYPLPDAWRDPVTFRALESRIGRRVFPVGRVDDAVLVVAEDGAVFRLTAGTTERLGATVDEALGRLVHGLSAAEA